MRVLGQALAEELHGHNRCLDEAERFEHRDIEQSVAHGGVRSDVGIVAILRSIGTSDEKCIDRMAVALLVAESESIGFGLIAETIGECLFYVCGRTAASRFGKFHADEGVEAHSASAKERSAVDGAMVEPNDRGCVDHFHRGDGIHGDLEMTRQTIAAAAGNDGERRFGVDERTGNLVDRAVASHRHHDVDAASCRFTGYLCTVAGIFGVTNLRNEAISIEIAFHSFQRGVFAPAARDGIDDEEDALHKQGMK